MKNKILVKIIGNSCCFEGCDSSAKYYFNYENNSYYLCEKHFNRIKNNFGLEFEINYDERKINSFSINGDFGIKSNFLMGAGHIISKMNQDKNWKRKLNRKVQKDINWHYAEYELKYLMEDNKEALELLYRQNPQQFPKE